MLYTALRLDPGVDTGSCSSYSMSVNKIREGSGGTEWTMGLPAEATGSGFGSFAGSPGGLSVDLLADGGLLLLRDRLDGRRIGYEDWESESDGHPSRRRRDC